MTRTFDELMKVLEEEGAISDEAAKKLITEHGDLTADEKKQVAAAVKMKKALSAKRAPVQEKKEDSSTGDGQGDVPAEVTMDDYLQALSTLDSDAASAEDRQKAEKIKEAFESQ